jgi:lysophospholipase L1-like esterase
MARFIAYLTLLLISACGGTSAPEAPPVEAPPPAKAQQTVVFVGDSITYLWSDLATLVPASVNAGVSGNDTWQMLARFDEDVLAKKPNIIVILGGINEIRLHQSQDTGAIMSMVQKAQAVNARVIVCTVLPAALSESDQLLIPGWNAQLKSGAQSYGYEIVDYYPLALLPDGTLDLSFFADGIHPNSAGYAAMWKVLRPVLARAGVQTQ